MDYYAIITDLGAELLAKATIENKPIVLTEIAIGDGAGDEYDPSPSQLSLANEVYRGALNYLRVDPKKKSRFDAQVIIPDTTGGYVIREAGLFDSSGNMVAIAKVPPTYKPDPISGASSQLYYEIILDYISDANVTINISPSDLFITKEILDTEISELKEYADTGDSSTLETANEYADEQDKLKSDITHGHNLTDTEVTGILQISKGGTGNIDNETSVVAGYPVVNQEFSETPSHLLAVRPATNNAEWLNFNHLKQSFVRYPDFSTIYKWEGDSKFYMPFDGWIRVYYYDNPYKPSIFEINDQEVYLPKEAMVLFPVLEGDSIFTTYPISFHKNRKGV